MQPLSGGNVDGSQPYRLHLKTVREKNVQVSMLKYYFGNVGLNTLLKLFCSCLFTFNAAIRKFNMLGVIAHVFFSASTREAEAVIARLVYTVSSRIVRATS